MNISKYINELLYRYDCVIIPNFGGFVSNKIGAKIDEETHMFFPPSKQISFNSYLKHNDGLLANHIASCENISFDKANFLISLEISSWTKSLSKSSIKLDSVGILSYNDENQICFEPLTDSNFDINSFGLSSSQGTNVFRISNLKSQQIKSETIEEDLSNLEPFTPNQDNRSKGKVIPIYIKYAASVAILMTLFSTYKMYDTKFPNDNLLASQETIQNKIEQATFLIEQPLSTVNFKVTLPSKNDQSINTDKPNSSSTIFIKKVDKKINSSLVNNKYFVISGAFRSLNNVEKKIKQLQAQGYNPKLVDKNKWGFNLVSYESFSNSKDAELFLKEIKKDDPDAWTFIKK